MSGSTFGFGGLHLDVSELTHKVVRGIRGGMILTGVLSVVLGALVLFWPGATLDVIAVLFGLYFIVSGAVRVVTGLVTPLLGGLRVLNILIGLLLFIAGVAAIRNPLASLTVLALFIGIAWIVEGIMSLTEVESGGSRWYAIAYGIISIIAGVVVLFLPVSSLAALVVFGGIALVVLGIVEVVRAFSFGRGLPRAY
ncbi:HdeD family acid-resistance protein [Arthrobacter sp. NPDC097144]|uniref:HdeD family acid-resistance protein n=1 Tax=Arthrobacter sp. NPDC097144 TaxID=3363946 RepID=UPI00380758A9